MRCASTRVLPEPAPATMSSGSPSWVTAARCCGFNPSSSASGSTGRPAPGRWPAPSGGSPPASAHVGTPRESTSPPAGGEVRPGRGRSSKRVLISPSRVRAAPDSAFLPSRRSTWLNAHTYARPMSTDPIRPAEPRDIPALLGLVQELADYEREPDAVEATPELFGASLFPAEGAPTAWAHVAEVDGEVVGMAVWYLTFSTWLGRPGIGLEDLYVQPGHRGGGLGRRLLGTLAQVCVERGYGRLEWWVLDWNEPSIGFYRSLGARAEDEWTTYRLDGSSLDRLAGSVG